MDADFHASADLALSRAAEFRSWDRLRRPIWAFDPHSLRGVYANPSAMKLWGAEELGELLARDFSGLSPAVLARTARLAQATADGAEVVEPWTFFPKGHPVTVQASISTYRMTDGRPVLLFEASALEVGPEERRATEALRHTSTLITLFEAGGAPIFSNPAAFSAYGLVGCAFDERFKDPTLGRELLHRALTGEAVAQICPVITVGGDRWHHLDVRKVLDPATGMAGVLLTEVDVTQRVQAEQARAAAEQKAAMAEARQQFLTDMSHDLRTPLNAVIGFSTVLRLAELPPKLASHVERIQESGETLFALMEEMIRVSDGDTDPPVLTRTITADTAPKAAPLEISPGARPPRVLYVDDNAHNRALVTTVLNAQGILCQTAEDGREGVDAATKAAWDIILMDIQMPNLDGVAASRAIRATDGPTRNAPIIAVTANTLPAQLADYRAAGMEDCIAKPIKVEALISTVLMWADPQVARTMRSAARR